MLMDKSKAKSKNVYNNNDESLINNISFCFLVCFDYSITHGKIYRYIDYCIFSRGQPEITEVRMIVY